MYYQNRACDYEPGRTDCPSHKTNFARPFPEGLQMVAGDPTRREFDASDITHRAINYMCIHEDGSEETNNLPLRRCTDLRAQVTFPSCWNGKDIDSRNHKDHVSFILPCPHWVPVS